MTYDDAIRLINDQLAIDAGQTVKGDEIKGWVHDPDDGGRCKLYLDAADCDELARAFRALALRLRQAPELPPSTHELKAWPLHYQALIDGLKLFELREDDRGFAPGDFLLLREWNPRTCEYTGRWGSWEVTSMISASDGPWLRRGCVCLSVVCRWVH